MLIDALLKIHAQIDDMKLGSNRQRQIDSLELEALAAAPSSEMKGLLR